MSCPRAVIFSMLVSLCVCSEESRFPPWFKFGSSTSAYQIEGAWNVSDKGENKWDRLVHRHPEVTPDRGNGDEACDSYHQWKRDVEVTSELGLDFYRFSLNWPRLLPTGFANYISVDGKNYYNSLIDGLLERGVEPMVTIYHAEMPQVLQELGGWTNPLITDWYADYARVVFTLFGDRVKTWITINEPLMECDWYHGPGPLGHGSTDGSEIGPYLCNKYILLAHAKAWRIYDEEFRHKYHGKLSLSNHLLWFQPYTTNDTQLTENTRQFFTGRYSHPIYSKKGGWSPEILKVLEQVRQWHGFTRPVIPPFTPEEIQFIKGTYDFYGANHYTTRLVRSPRPDEHPASFLLTCIPEIGAIFESKPDWEYGYNIFLPIVPEGIREQLAWLKQQYGDIEIMITENGLSSHGADLEDTTRITFIKKYLEQVLLSIKDGVNVTGYAYWSIMDDFEWLDGYQSQFGLYEVDFSDPLRTRTPRISATYYRNIIRHRSLNHGP